MPLSCRAGFFTYAARRVLAVRNFTLRPFHRRHGLASWAYRDCAGDSTPIYSVSWQLLPWFGAADSQKHTPLPPWMVVGRSIYAPGPSHPKEAPGKCGNLTWDCSWCSTSCFRRRLPLRQSPAIKTVFQGSASTGPVRVTTDGSEISASTAREDSSKSLRHLFNH